MCIVYIYVYVRVYVYECTKWPGICCDKKKKKNEKTLTPADVVFTSAPRENRTDIRMVARDKPY